MDAAKKESVKGKTIRVSRAVHARNRVRRLVLWIRWLYLTRYWKMNIHRETLISTEAKLDKTNPKGVYIGRGTAVSFGATILAHDYIRRMYPNTHIGEFCQIGANSIIMPGVTVGDHSIVAAGAVVVKDVPPRTIVGGNPAKVIREGIDTVWWGRLAEYDDGTH